MMSIILKKILKPKITKALNHSYIVTSIVTCVKGKGKGKWSVIRDQGSVVWGKDRGQVSREGQWSGVGSRESEEGQWSVVRGKDRSQESEGRDR